MSSVAQIEANRQNAQQSTGPVTPEGKEACCRNAVKHGLLSSRILAPGESAEEFEALRRAVFEDLVPQGAVEELLADRAVQQAWRLGRVTGMIQDLLDGGLAGSEDPRRLDLLRRYERTIEQGMYHALRELRAMQKARRDEARRRVQDEERRIRLAAADARREEEAARRRRREAHEEESRQRRRDREDESRRREESLRPVKEMIAREKASAIAMDSRLRQDRVARALAKASAYAKEEDGEVWDGEAEDRDE